MAILPIHQAQLEYAKNQPWFPAFVHNLLADTDSTFNTIMCDQSIVDSFKWANANDDVHWASVDASLLYNNGTTSREDIKACLAPYRESNPEWFI